MQIWGCHTEQLRNLPLCLQKECDGRVAWKLRTQVEALCKQKVLYTQQQTENQTITTVLAAF